MVYGGAHCAVTLTHAFDLYAQVKFPLLCDTLDILNIRPPVKEDKSQRKSLYDAGKHAPHSPHARARAHATLTTCTCTCTRHNAALSRKNV